MPSQDKVKHQHHDHSKEPEKKPLPPKQSKKAPVKSKKDPVKSKKPDTEKPLPPTSADDGPSGINLKPYLVEEEDSCCSDKKSKSTEKERKTFTLGNDNKTALHIDIRDLPDAIISVIEDGRFTPLIIDGNKDRVDTYFQYSGGPMEALIVDAKALVLKTQLHKTMTLEEGKESLRQSLVSSLRYGKAFALLMTDSAFNPNKFNSSDSFPVDLVFTRAGRDLMKQENYEKILRLPQDAYPHGIFVPHPEFKVIITTRFDLEDYYEFLEGAQFPLDRCYPIYVKETTGN